MVEKVIEVFSGVGFWGVEFFVVDDGVYFFELFLWFYDIGMVIFVNI